ncbi:holo-ACP synthase [Peptococcaceae bacterium 1198_IL3148]
MLTGVGTDTIEIERIAKACTNERFLERIYTLAERQYCFSHKNPYPSLAARFAAKEAVLKALGTGLAGCRFTDIEVIANYPGGPPTVKLSGGARKVADKKGVDKVLISLSHDRTTAVAFAVAVAGGDHRCS